MKGDLIKHVFNLRGGFHLKNAVLSTTSTSLRDQVSASLGLRSSHILAVLETKEEEKSLIIANYTSTQPLGKSSLLLSMRNINNDNKAQHIVLSKELVKIDNKELTFLSSKNNNKFLEINEEKIINYFKEHASSIILEDKDILLLISLFISYKRGELITSDHGSVASLIELKVFLDKIINKESASAQYPPSYNKEDEDNIFID